MLYSQNLQKQTRNFFSKRGGGGAVPGSAFAHSFLSCHSELLHTIVVRTGEWGVAPCTFLHKDRHDAGIKIWCRKSIKGSDPTPFFYSKILF